MADTRSVYIINHDRKQIQRTKPLESTKHFSAFYHRLRHNQITYFCLIILACDLGLCFYYIALFMRASCSPKYINSVLCHTNMILISVFMNRNYDSQRKCGSIICNLQKIKKGILPMIFTFVCPCRRALALKINK